MHAALLSRPLEVTMLTRRIAASACALALVAPAAAVAHPADNGPVVKHQPTTAVAGDTVLPGHTKYDLPNQVNQTPVVYGSTQYDLQNQQDQGSPKPSYADQVAAMSPAQLSAAYGAQNPSVTADVYVPPADPTKVYKAPAATETPVASANDTSDDGWQIAAIAEAGILAALAVGSVALVRARRRSPLGA
jgi:hypothetical protein